MDCHGRWWKTKSHFGDFCYSSFVIGGILKLSDKPEHEDHTSLVLFNVTWRLNFRGKFRIHEKCGVIRKREGMSIVRVNKIYDGKTPGHFHY